MRSGLLRNEFCEFPWPGGLRWKFQSAIYGDSKTLVLSPRGKALHGLVQAWDLAGNDLRTIHATHWRRLASAPLGFPPGISVERIAVNGQFSDWLGVSNREPKDSPRFVDYELISSSENIVVYYRRSTHDVDGLDLRRELSLVKISDPSQWLAGAEVDWIPIADRG